MNRFTLKRFSYLDGFAISVCAINLGRGQYITGIILWLALLLLSMVAESFVENRQKKNA